MKLLLDERKLIIAIGNTIEFGVWGNVDNLPSWRLSQTSYTMDANYTLVDIGDIEIPTYVKAGQYYYINGEFKLADECPNEYRERIVNAEDSIVTIEDAMCETEVYNDERIAELEDALCELSMLIETLQASK